jgi:hypothetical protein
MFRTHQGRAFPRQGLPPRTSDGLIGRTAIEMIYIARVLCERAPRAKYRVTGIWMGRPLGRPELTTMSTPILQEESIMLKCMLDDLDSVTFGMRGRYQWMEGRDTLSLCGDTMRAIATQAIAIRKLSERTRLSLISHQFDLLICNYRTDPSRLLDFDVLTCTTSSFYKSSHILCITKLALTIFKAMIPLCYSPASAFFTSSFCITAL